MGEEARWPIGSKGESSASLESSQGVDMAVVKGVAGLPTTVAPSCSLMEFAGLDESKKAGT
jgi:hypothetical protein